MLIQPGRGPYTRSSASLRTRLPKRDIRLQLTIPATPIDDRPLDPGEPGAEGAASKGSSESGAGPLASKRGRLGWYRDPLLLVALALAFGLDQLTKWLITTNLEHGESIPADGFFRLTYVSNTGSAFGLLQDQGTMLTIISFTAVALMIYLYRSTPQLSTTLRLALGMMLGGAAGNLLDRLRLGWVVDFVDVGPWPIFNVADSSIVVGIAILVWYFGTGRDGGREATHTSASTPAGADGDAVAGPPDGQPGS